METDRTPRNKKKGVPAVVIILLVLLAVTAIAYMSFDRYFAYVKNYDKAFEPGNTKTVTFTVQKGSTAEQIGNDLEAQGLIKSSKLFLRKTKMLGLGQSYKAGEFELSASMTMEEIMKALQTVKARETLRFTIPEGLSLIEVAEKLAQQGATPDAETFIAACDESYDYWFLDGKGSGYGDGTGRVPAHANRLEGFLFPDTYEIYKDVPARDIVDKMLARFDEVFTPEYQDRLKELGIDINEAATIASLIEEETKTDSERPLVSSVIYNRLKKKMKLQFCSTVQYALGEHKSRLYYADLEVDSPYNTYKYEGLPAGPIAGFGRASLNAALYPEDTNYLYFVLKKQGGSEHNFSSNGKQFSIDKNSYIDTITD